MEMTPLHQQILAGIKNEAELHPNYPDLHHQLGFLYMTKGDLSKAERNLLEALHLNPNYREAINNLRHLYIEMKRWKEAEDLFLSELNKYPHDGFPHHLLGIFYVQMEMKEKAALQFRKAVQLDASYQDLYRKIGIWKKGKIFLN